MYKKTEEIYNQDVISDDEDAHKERSATELVNQANLFAKARAMSDNGGNWFSDDKSSSDENDKANGNKFAQFKNNSEGSSDDDKPQFGSKK